MDAPTQVFCSMRFNAQGPQKEANLLKETLAEKDIQLNIIDVKPGHLKHHQNWIRNDGAVRRLRRDGDQ